MKYFGTDGIRRKANEFTLDFLTSIAIGLTDYAEQKFKNKSYKVLLAGDTRESSEWILQDLTQILESLGVEYANAGILPTPAINFCFSKMGFDFAIDITASHNPFFDNGIKIFEVIDGVSQKLSEKGCEIIESAIQTKKSVPLISTTDRADLHTEALEIYKQHLLDYIEETNFSNLNIGIDCANGATSVINEQLFKELGAKTTLINSNENYNQEINQNCGSTHLEQLITLVLKNKLDFGVAFDGDGDRVLMIDEKGEVVDGDEIIAILAKSLGLNSIAVTVATNQGLLNWAKENHIKTAITAVGDSNVAIAMKEQDIKIGGEQSGHIILPNESTGDGMLTALMVTKIIAKAGRPFSELKVITKLPQTTTNLPATKTQKEALSSLEAKNLIQEYNKKLESVSGRLLIRPSGTEDLIRITLWGDDLVKIENLTEELKVKLGEIL